MDWLLPVTGAALASLMLFRFVASRGRSDDSRSARPGFQPVTQMTHEILEAGRGERPSRHDRVSVHYTGWLADGKVFDSSRKRGIALTFTVGRGEVIRGWDETVLDMQEGETRVVTLPPDLAYGDRGVGPIPPGACLRFEMMLERIERFS